MPYLIQLLLPRNVHQTAVPSERFEQVRDELTKEFGGVTVYSQMPAEGLWKAAEGDVQRDEMVLFEVMTETIQKDWWRSYRHTLEQRFEQDEVVIRAHQIERL